MMKPTFLFFIAYFPIVILPRGARTIQISEKALSRNYLAVRDIYGKYFLNGNWHLSSATNTTSCMQQNAPTEYKSARNKAKQLYKAF